jgi:hypothetical protein
MKYDAEMGSGAMIHIPSFIKTGSGNRKLIGGGGDHKQQGDLISLLLFFQNKEIRLKFTTSRPTGTSVSFHFTFRKHYTLMFSDN